MTLYLYLIYCFSLLPILAFDLPLSWGPVFLSLAPLAAFVLGAFSIANKPPAIPPLFWPAVALAAGRSISVFVSPSDLGIPHVLAAWLIPLTVLVVQPRRDRARGALLFLGYALVALALVQIKYQNLFLNRNLLGMALLGPLAASMPELEKRQYLPAALFGLGILATLSRVAILSSALMMAGYLGLFFKAIPATLAALPLLIKIRNSKVFYFRFHDWGRALAGFAESMLFGYGQGGRHPHSVYINVLAGSGLFGAGLLWVALWRTRGAWASLPRWALWGLFAFGLAGLIDDWSVWAITAASVGALLGLSHPAPRPS